MNTAPTPTLLLVDGSSYLYRAFHAMPDLRSSTRRTRRAWCPRSGTAAHAWVNKALDLVELARAALILIALGGLL